jgi:hypothetical protein
MKSFSTMGLRPRHTAALIGAQGENSRGNTGWDRSITDSPTRRTNSQYGPCATTLEASGAAWTGHARAVRPSTLGELFALGSYPIGAKTTPKDGAGIKPGHRFASITIAPSVTRAAGRARLQARGVGLVGIEGRG